MTYLQLDLPNMAAPGTLREASQWFQRNALECGYWTRRMHADHCRYLLESFGEDMELAALTYERIREYVEREKMRIARESIRKRLVTLRMILEESHRRGLLDKVPPFPVIKGDSRPKEDFWLEAEWRLAHQFEQDEDFRTWVDLAWWLGSHTSDIYRLRWSDIDWEANTWIRRNTKGKVKPWPLPLPDRLREILWERWDRLRPPSRDMVCGRNFGHPNRRLKQLCRDAGVPLVCPLGLRRSCGTYLAESGVSEDFQRLWFGHTSDSVIIRKHYRRPTQAVIEQGIRAINARR